jgi:hypothetical protein
MAAKSPIRDQTSPEVFESGSDYFSKLSLNAR